MSRSASRALLLAAALALAACSSAPKQTDTATDVKNHAAESALSGNTYYRQGRYELALQFFTQALNENLSVDNEEGVVQSYNSIGRVYLAVGMNDEAESAFAKASSIAVRLGGAPLFVTSNNLGELYLRRGDARGAVEIFERVLGGSLKDVQQDQVGLLYHNLGSAYKATGDYARAMEWLRKALAVDLDQKLFEEAAADYYMIASVHSKQGDYKSAAENAQLALDNDKRTENALGVIKDLLALGLIASRAGDPAAAYRYFERSHLAATALGSTADIRSALEGLISSGEALGKTAEVAAYRKALADLGSP
ncbi:MAG: tetratricopeptide repeat protein [Spirochaetes bacterium]|nr:tetratricopeptide repeat protein [Spirochaetota bacterium]